jgi:hypothetical protein
VRLNNESIDSIGAFQVAEGFRRTRGMG